MKKEVMLAIRGLQSDPEGQDALETETAAEYYFRNNHHYIVYEEVQEGFRETTRNLLKFDESVLEVTKKGTVNVTMRFEQNRKSRTTYHTPFGSILLEIDTRTLEIIPEEEGMRISVNYVLCADGQPLSECEIQMKMSEKKRSQPI